MLRHPDNLKTEPQRGLSIDSRTLAGHCVKAGLEKKAQDVVILDLSSISIFADFFVIASGSSTRQVKAIAGEIEETLSGMHVEPDHIEGAGEGRWILMDYGDTLVHIFLEDVRIFYNLERLWGDAPRLTPEDLLGPLTP